MDAKDRPKDATLKSGGDYQKEHALTIFGSELGTSFARRMKCFDAEYSIKSFGECLELCEISHAGEIQLRSDRHCTIRPTSAPPA